MKRPDLRIAYWHIEGSGRHYTSLEQAWDLRCIAGLDHRAIHGYNRSGKIVVEAPATEGRDE